MHLKDINEITNHRITCGSDYGWNCYPDARSLDYESTYADISVVYNPESQSIYEVTISVNSESDSEDQRPYRWFNPAYKEAYYKECKTRKVKKNLAWDDVKYINLETEEDFLEKAKAIFNGIEDFDKRVQVPVELEDDVMLQLCMEAHKRDITLNQMVEKVLRTAIDEYDRKKLTEDYAVDIG